MVKTTLLFLWKQNYLLMFLVKIDFMYCIIVFSLLNLFITILKKFHRSFKTYILWKHYQYRIQFCKNCINRKWIEIYLCTGCPIKIRHIFFLSGLKFFEFFIIEISDFNFFFLYFVSFKYFHFWQITKLVC